MSGAAPAAPPSAARWIKPRWLAPLQILALILGVLSLAVASRLTLSGDLTDLFPRGPEAEALATFTRAFGGGDVGLVLVRGEDPASVARAAKGASQGLEGRPTVQRVVTAVPEPRPADPTLAWLHAGPSARAALARALTPRGMRERLAETRTLLLAPGGTELAELAKSDPLRLSMIPWEGRTELAAGVVADQDGSFVADGGKARLVVLEPRGRVFDPRAAEGFVLDVESALAGPRASHPDVRFDLTGGHAVAYATERMIRRDLYLSTALSFALSAAVFLVTFRRGRALFAVLPPLMLGTVWTTALAALIYPRLSSLSVAFTSVVVGVGVDTGVHVYGALLGAKREGLGPEEAAERARRASARPTLTAAVAASLAFGALGISDIKALGQLGVLCAIGEVLTAVAILLFAPDIGAWLERGPTPCLPPPPWVAPLAALTRGGARSALAMLSLPALLVVLAALGLPRTGEAVVALRPSSLEPLRTSDAIYGLFGGRPNQWIVLAHDPDLQRASAEIDAVAEALEPLVKDGTIDGYDAMSTYVPSVPAQRARLAQRDALDLPGRRAELEKALDEAGFDGESFAPAMASFAAPRGELVAIPVDRPGSLSLVVARHVQRYEAQYYVAAYVRPTGVPAQDERAREIIRGASPSSVITGFATLEVSLKQTLVRDLPRVALVASLFVAAALGFTLRSAREVVIALVALAAEIVLVALAMRLLHIRWHVYDALVLPVLLGITLDEVLFLLHAARDGDGATKREGASVDRVDRALGQQAPLSAATALTTSAGFGALMECRFEGLFDLGAVGAIGSAAGLLASLVIVPAGLRLLGPRT